VPDDDSGPQASFSATTSHPALKNAIHRHKTPSRDEKRHPAAENRIPAREAASRCRNAVPWHVNALSARHRRRPGAENCWCRRL